MALLNINQYGDKVLRQRAAPVTDIDGAFVELCNNMFDTMYDAPGIGLAGPQVGVLKRFFVYDFEDKPDVIINPEILETEGTWTFKEGCLSIPGVHMEVVRPKKIWVRSINLDGEEIEFVADELFARVIQHETDHLDGVLFLDHLNKEDNEQAHLLIELYKKELAEQCNAAANAKTVKTGDASQTQIETDTNLRLP